MKPMAVKEGGEGMLEYLEDIIGTNRYKDAVVKVEAGIERLEEERKDKLSRVKITEKEKERWEPLYAAAVEYLKKKNEKTRLQNVLVQTDLHKLNKEAEKNKEDLEVKRSKEGEREGGRRGFVDLHSNKLIVKHQILRLTCLEGIFVNVKSLRC